MNHPQTINHFVGQANVIDRVKVALEHSWQDSIRFPHTAITGPPGTGKTTVAYVIGKELAVTVHERLAQAVNSIASMRGALVSMAEKEILFIDEAHQLDPDVQVILFRAMESQILTIRNTDHSTVNLPLPSFTVILATTDLYRLLEPLRDRCALVLPFQHYDEASLITIAHQNARAMQVELSDEIAKGIAERSKGTPRLAIRLLHACYRFARSQGENTISLDHFCRAVVLEGLDSIGLDEDQQRYLQLLATRNGEPIRLFTISSALGIHRRSIQDVVEPFLLRSGLIERTQNGRLITKQGLAHLGLLHDAKVTAN